MSSGGRIAGGPLIAGAGGIGGGGKGGGGAARTPTTATDTLNSTQYAQVIDLIGEGEIAGLKDGLKSIFLDNTPLQNTDGTFNFQNVAIYTRNGTQNQDAIPFAGVIEDERPVSVTVRNDGPVTRTITDSQTEAVRVTISVPRLERITDQGDTVGESARLQIAVQYNGGGFTTYIDDTIAGRSGDLYQRDYLVGLAGAFPVDVRVTRITPDSNDLRTANEFSWSSYTEIIYARIAYPNSALVGIRIDAEQFNNIPSRSYRVRGIKVAVPSNATVDQSTGALIYSGVWNGTFGAAQWTSDPAWILWDLLTSARYGFGEHILPASLDKFAFFAASQYCSALDTYLLGSDPRNGTTNDYNASTGKHGIPNGFGGYEPRFSCNTNIQTQEDAFKLINDMCSVFRVMPYWGLGSLTVSQDKPADPAYLFTQANVTEDGFSYSNSSLKTRPNVAVVSYLDLELRDTVFEVVEDAENIGKYGVIKTEISAFACTSRGQARRIGEWILYSERYENETITFTVSLDAGVVVRPGQVIEVADPVKAGARRGGRITAATTTAITVDDATGLTASGAQLSAILPSGTVEKRAIASIAGNVITVSTAFTTAPSANSVWIYETSNIQPSTWRVLAIQEQDAATYAISALSYNSSKYEYIERDQPLQQRDITDLNILPEAPTNLTATEVLYDGGGIAKSKLTINWQPVLAIKDYRVRWRYGSDNWNISDVTRFNFEILDTSPGVYTIEVYSIGVNLRTSLQPALLTAQAFGKTAPPADVIGVSLTAIDGASAVINWDRAIDLDVLLGGKVLIRHNVALIAPTWEDSQDIVPAAAGSQTQKQVPLLEGSYLLKFEDESGNQSVNATALIVDLPTAQSRFLVNVYAEDQEAPPFSGNATGMYYDAALNGLVIGAGQLIDDIAPDGNFDALPSIDVIGGVSPAGEYEFGSYWDMGSVFDVNIRRRIVANPILPGQLFDDNTQLIDEWPEIDYETKLAVVNAELYVRTTNDDPTGTPVYGDWNQFANAIVRGRGFQFKTIATSSNPSVSILITELGVEMELQLRTEQSAVLTSSASAYAVTFTNAFYQAPNIGITASNMATGDFFLITAVTRLGFTVEFRNSAGTAVSRQFSYTAVGYGKEI